MHILFLGTCRDLHASSLAYWLRNNLMGLHGTLAEQLQQVSIMLKRDCLAAGLLCVISGTSCFFDPL